jgi:hypothetical protein
MANFSNGINKNAEKIQIKIVAKIMTLAAAILLIEGIKVCM